MATIVFCGAHPDDETILAGATLSLLAEQGHDVRVVCATRGEGGEMGDPPVVPKRDLLGDMREQELIFACQALGVNQLSLLPYIDPIVGADNQLYPFTEDMDLLVERLRELVAEADVVLTHGSNGEYGHPAHVLMHQAVLKAVAGTPKLVYGVAAALPDTTDRLWNQDDPAHLCWAIAPHAKAKLAAIECHVSQLALFKRALELTDLRDIVVARPYETFHRHYPPVDDTPPHDLFSQALLAAGATRP